MAKMDNANQRLARPGTHQHMPAIDAYKKRFGVCDLFNRQIKHRTRGERGKQVSFLHSSVFYSTLSMRHSIREVAYSKYLILTSMGNCDP